MTDDIAQQLLRRLERLEGIVIAHQVALRALITCHPSPEDAQTIVRTRLERIAGTGLYMSVPEETVIAMHKEAAAIVA